MGVTSSFRQAEFASFEELERELQSSTPDGQPTMHPRAALLTGERSDLYRIEETPGVGQLAYPVRVLTRPLAAAHDYTHASDPRGAVGQ
jgi:hypothetical protein